MSLLFLLTCLFVGNVSAKYNVLFILADDLGYYDLGHKDNSLQTPNILALQDEGVQFKWSYTQSLCTPSRAALLTGHYSYRTGLQSKVIETLQPKGLPTKFTLLPEELQKHGYKTYMYGKWHIGSMAWEHYPTNRGFDHFMGFLSGQQGYYNHFPFDQSDDDTGEPAYVWSYDFRTDTSTNFEALASFGPDLLVNDMVSTIKNGSYDEESPFFMYWAAQQPHLPLQPKTADLKRYGLSDSNIDNASNRQMYKSLLSSLDTQVGRVVDALKDAGVYNNTVIVFSSDNGGQVTSGACNYPLRGWKGEVLEGGNRVMTFVTGSI